ncbi:carbohydrate-binding module family 21 protein [Boletus reticuloceps]|uniref:Carbohydrate-binding module family 21 protein n=1 Tax=Boletus reticuloceps TaxID=495285 RepID=A0A8I3AFM6_9AGAM|nr:carbohydrate-binding module family 21 protein [Boletus reticuloceps]
MLCRRSFSGERGPGTFHSLGVLPKRNRDKSPVFHIAHDDDDDDHSSSIEEHIPVSPPPSSVRFPTSRSLSSPSSPTLRPTSPHPQLPRGASTPILLSNGKPLKPSLKSSSSSPAMLIPLQAQQMHLRARSEPPTPKNVHFPEKDYALATVCVFKRSARPAALSNPAIGNGDETETEGEDTPIRFPSPSLPPIFNYEINPTQSSPVPSKSGHPANLVLESLNLSSSSSTNTATKPLLTGSILIHNLAFEKHVAVRFTLDDWQTVSEVGAHYLGTLSLLPSKIFPSTTDHATSHRGRGWDRFTFAIRLEDYAHSLSTRTLWLVARYRVNSTYPEPCSSHYGPGGEWWDNNGGGNYRIGFRPVVASPSSSRSKLRRETISAPIPSSCPRPQPPMTCKEHALGLMVPSVSKGGRCPTPLRTGKLNLCNYVPPTVHATPSISFPCVGSPQTSSTSLSSTNTTLPPSAALRSLSDEDSTSPASSTLSTPSVSPIIIPRVIIGGQPATSTYSPSEDDDNATRCSRPSHIAGWDWSASSKPRVEASSRQHVDLVPGSESPDKHDIPLPPGIKALHGSNSLYDTFVSQWCFAQGPSPSHHVHDGGGIMA